MIRGGLPLTKKIGEVESHCFSVRGALSDCSHYIYGISDIPAFVAEEYMTSPKNFLSAMYFELADYTNPFTGIKKSIKKEWRDVEDELRREDYFGGQLKRTSLFKKSLVPVIAGAQNDRDKAKAVYDYIKKTIKWNNLQARGSNEGIAEAIEKHTGNSGDINLALITALNAAGINTEAVLLSTRSNGLVNKLYPTVDDFDYVIAKANIGDKSYFLDATDPLLPFGMLPLKCLNGDGRAISLDKPSYWVDVNPGQRRSSTYMLDLTLGQDGKVKGTLVHFSVGYEAYEKRKAIKKFNSVDEYIDDWGSKLNKIKISKSTITNVDSVDMPITETYDIEFTTTRNMNASSIRFNPFIFDRQVNNPFKLTERNYPVDMGMPSDRRFVLTMHLPEQYTIENAPQPVALTMPNQAGRFITSYDPAGNTFTISDITQFNKSVYAPDEYPYLKELFNKIITSEKAELLFKKKI